MSTSQLDQSLAAVQRQFPDFDLATFDFYDPASLKRVGLFSTNGHAKSETDAIVKHLEGLKGPQRLVRVVGDRAIADKLLKRNLGSARQIAALAEHQFVRDHADVFGGSAGAGSTSLS